MNAWTVLTAVFLVRLILSVYVMCGSASFVLRKRALEDGSRSLQKERTKQAVFLIIPLLRERSVVERLFARFVEYLKVWDELYLVLVTTEREAIEDATGQNPTAEAVIRLVRGYDGDPSRVLHFHYPTENLVVGEQLNFALRQLRERVDLPLAGCYIVVYNADSVVDSVAMEEIRRVIREGHPVAQQSALFLANVPALLARWRLLEAGHGLYQSIWTLRHEMPRYLGTPRMIPFLPRVFDDVGPLHCVSHGLVIKLDVLTMVGDFPVLSLGAEDLALGVALRAYGYGVEAVRALENAETPDTLGILFRQLAGWFLGTLGYACFWRLIPGHVRRRSGKSVVSVTVFGLLDSIKWLAKGPLVVGYLVMSAVDDRVVTGVTVYVAYVYAPLVILLWLWGRLPGKLFPRPPFMALGVAVLLYWIVPIVRSAPAMLGLWWGLKILAGAPFKKPKTERADGREG